MSSTWEYENDRVDHSLPPLVRSAASKLKYLVSGVFLFEDNNEDRTVLLMNLHKDNLCSLIKDDITKQICFHAA